MPKKTPIEVNGIQYKYHTERYDNRHTRLRVWQGKNNLIIDEVWRCNRIDENDIEYTLEMLWIRNIKKLQN